MRLFQYLVTMLGCLLFLSGLKVSGQTGTIHGFVFDKASGEPMVLVHIYLDSTTIGTISGQDGYFSLSQIPQGKYLLVCQSLGYKPERQWIGVKDDQVENINIHLEKSDIQLDAAVISGRLLERKSRVQLSQMRLTPIQISKIPTMGINSDLAQYVQILPGIVSSGDQGGQLYIRGGSPVQNLVLMDGIPLYNPFHSMGMFSVFDTDLINSANISTGGYPAKYGGRVSSVMDINLKDGNRNYLSGKVSAGLMSANASLEGPLHFSKKSAPLTFLVSGKYSYLDRTAPYLNPEIQKNSLPFKFSDLVSKLTYKGDSGSKISATGFHFTDKVQFSENQLYQWTNYGVGIQAVLLPQNSNGLIRADVNYSMYNLDLEELLNNKRYSEIEDIKVGMEFLNQIGRHEMQMGAQILGVHTDYFNKNTFGFSIDENTDVTDLAGYISFQFNYEKWLVQPGIRMNYYASLGTLVPEPRFGIKYLLSNSFRIKAGGGYYSQNLISGKSDRDVVNFFSGFLMDPSNIANDTGPKQLPNRLQTSWQGIIGLEWDPAKDITINIEGFYKDFPQLISLNSNKKFGGEMDHWDIPPVYYEDFITETGNAYGIEGLVQYEKKRVFIWLAYSLSNSNRFDGLQYFQPHYDRRHNLNIVGSYVMGKDLNWKIMGRWNYGSGFPFTPTNALYEKLRLSNTSSAEVLYENGLIGMNFGDYNSARLPSYHRLDLTLKYIHYFSDRNSLEAVISVTNVYNRENLFYFSREDYKRVNQLPLLPSGGLIWRF